MNGWAMTLAAAGLLCAVAQAVVAGNPGAVPVGFTTVAPREELKPEFGWDPKGGPKGKGAFFIKSDSREGLQGHWRYSRPVTGGKWYRFSAIRRVTGAASPRRTAVARPGRGAAWPHGGTASRRHR